MGKIKLQLLPLPNLARREALHEPSISHDQPRPIPPYCCHHYSYHSYGFVAIEVVRVLRDIRACVKNFKGKNTKELYKQIKEVASHPRHFFRRSGIPLKPS